MATLGASRGYHVIQCIGKGSFGEALLVRDCQGDMRVMKAVRLSGLSQAREEEAKNEAIILSSLRHPYLVRYRDSFTEDGALAIVMDFAEAGDLLKRIRIARQEQRIFSEARVFRWFTQAAVGLKYLHGLNIVHRDVKSENYFLTTEETLLLGDFGLARKLPRGSPTLIDNRSVGTPYYLSPEIFSEEGLYSCASDIWALGCMLYEMAALRVPFQAQNLPSLMARICNGPTPTFPSVYSVALGRLCGELLFKERRRRPSALDLVRRPDMQAEARRLLLEAQEKRASAAASGSRGPWAGARAAKAAHAHASAEVQRQAETARTSSAGASGASSSAAPAEEPTVSRREEPAAASNGGTSAVEGGDSNVDQGSLAPATTLGASAHEEARASAHDSLPETTSCSAAEALQLAVRSFMYCPMLELTKTGEAAVEAAKTAREQGTCTPSASRLSRSHSAHRIGAPEQHADRLELWAGEQQEGAEDTLQARRMSKAPPVQVPPLNLPPLRNTAHDAAWLTVRGSSRLPQSQRTGRLQRSKSAASLGIDASQRESARQRARQDRDSVGRPAVPCLRLRKVPDKPDFDAAVEGLRLVPSYRQEHRDGSVFSRQVRGPRSSSSATVIRSSSAASLAVLDQQASSSALYVGKRQELRPLSRQGSQGLPYSLRLGLPLKGIGPLEGPGAALSMREGGRSSTPPAAGPKTSRPSRAAARGGAGPLPRAASAASISGREGPSAHKGPSASGPPAPPARRPLSALLR